MKTFYELYREQLSDRRWKQDIEDALAELSREMSFPRGENGEEFRLELCRVREQLSQGELPREDSFIIAGYLFDDFEGFLFGCVPMFSVEDVLGMENIRPWDALLARMAAAYEKMEPCFDILDDRAVCAALSCIHRLPPARLWRDCISGTAFGCFVHCDLPPAEFIKEVIRHQIRLSLKGEESRELPLDCIDRDEIPLPTIGEDEYDFLEDNAMDEESVTLRRILLLSYLSLYEALLKARAGLLAEK